MKWKENNTINNITHTTHNIDTNTVISSITNDSSLSVLALLSSSSLSLFPLLLLLTHSMFLHSYSFFFYSFYSHLICTTLFSMNDRSWQLNPLLCLCCCDNETNIDFILLETKKPRRRTSLIKKTQYIFIDSSHDHIHINTSNETQSLNHSSSEQTVIYQLSILFS